MVREWRAAPRLVHTVGSMELSTFGHASMINCPYCQTTNHPRNAVCSTCGAPLVADPALEGDPFVGRQLGGRFVLESIIGSGEIGMVYRGTDQRSRQAVAVKLVHPDVAATHGDELLRSASMVAQLRHAKIATVLAAAREPDGTSYIVTEFVEGKTLKTLVEETGPLGPRRTADILFQLCSALAPIHRAGRPHANLKPENVFLVAKEDADFVKIVDVGSPDLFGVRDTLAGKIIIGTPKYFSPEQATGQRVGLASDQFTLGVIGYQLLTGALPFFGATPDQLLSSIASGTPTPVNERVSGRVSLPEKLVETVHRCLDKDPKGRYADLRSLATDLAAVIKSTPADPTPAPRPVKKTFGGGLDLSTRMADPGSLDDVAARAASFMEHTRVQDPGGTMETLLEPEQTPPQVAPPRPPSANSMASIPEPLAVTGAIDSDDLSAALADALASVDGGGGGARGGAARLDAALADALSAVQPSAAPEPATPKHGNDLSADLAAALAGAEAEISGGGNGGFDPFGDVIDDSPPPSAPVAPPASTAVQPSSRSNAILEALDEEVSGTSGKINSAAPLATAADFAALSPLALEQARSAQSKRTTIPPTSAKKDSKKGLLLLLLLLLLGGAGGGVWWFLDQQQAPAPEPALPKPRPKRPAPPPPPAELKVTLDSDPQGAAVKLGDKELGKTPLEVVVEGVDTLAYDLVLEGYEPSTLEVGPAKLADMPEPRTLKAPLKKATEEAPKPEPDPKGAPPPKAPEPAKQPAAAQGAGGAENPAVAPKPKPKPKPRRKPKKKKPKASDIKDPFAD